MSHAPAVPSESTPAGDAPDADSSLAPDDAFHVLQSARRRAAIRYLADRRDAERVEMRDLAEQVAAWEHDTTVRALSSDERQRVYISLYQCHLPKLDDLDLIDYDQSRGHVTPADRFDDVVAYLRLDDADEAETDDGPDGYVRGMAGTGLVLTGASLLGVVPAALTSLLPALVTGLFAALTVRSFAER